jgi:hypothetical protein
MMPRQQVIESICSAILSNSGDKKSLLNEILVKFTTNQMTEDDALDAMNSVIKYNPSQLSKSIKSRTLRSSAHSYLEGSLGYIDSLKLVSSLITHSIIESQILDDPSIIESLSTFELIRILKDSLYTHSISTTDHQILSDLLINYGYSEKGGNI